MKFKVGDRVAVYEDGMRRTGEVTDHNGPYIEVRTGIKYSVLVYPQQCRRLKKREPRRVWIEEYDVQKAGEVVREAMITTLVEPGTKGWVEFIEAPKARGKR